MKALRYFGERDIQYGSTDDAALTDDRDVLVRVKHCAICGSDLHIYHGHGFSQDTGFCVGHEAVGEVIETGRAVRTLRSGDRVMISAAVGCGACPGCLAGRVHECENNGAGCYGLSAALQGSQAEAVRVPAGDVNARRIPDGISDEQALMLTDALPTSWMAVRNADIKPGATVAVIGLGPIGLMAVEGCFAMGAGRVYAIDLVPERRAIAAGLGAIGVDPSAAVDTIREETGGRLCSSVVEAVGADATIDLALRLVGKWGTVSCLGVNQTRRFPFPMERAFASGLTFRTGTCSVPHWWPELVPMVQQGRLRPERYISHRLPLSQGAEAYAVLDRREALKVVMTPD
ncbi:alcohol dehydrogenase catalytic domain-containing protein [Sphingomonas sp. NBWT7]|uniref:alcohol dehydrogenase family protein n=1 Tax=Sphingomonas sp. NBWT7 TaxID=2596913 RepID=UPI00162A2818|nr:alcohol dehydrogenase family protein [Sphingomonas sp. NBWT7]QNE32277.1 alcohol dehydrogenase catalytic domain-containing protein [Sphingomonas sp. NBWT7]